MEPMDPIKSTVLTPQTSCPEIYDYHTYCTPRMGGDFISFRESKDFTTAESGTREPSNQTVYLTFGRWRRAELDMTNNRKELIAIDKALDAFQPRLEAQGVRHILIQSDNTTAVYNINKKAAAASLYLDLRHLLKKSEKLNLIMTAIHILGIENCCKN
jgi:hypothetical protein